MCVCKGGPHGSQPVDVRSLGLRVSTQMTHPVVQVVDRNEENVGPIVRRDDASGQGSKNKGQEQSFHGEVFSKGDPVHSRQAKQRRKGMGSYRLGNDLHGKIK